MIEKLFEPTFSIFLNTRNRQVKLQKFIDSVKRRTSNLLSIEILMGVDSDDPNIPFYLRLVEDTPIEILLLVRQRSGAMQDEYHNRMARASKGKLLWVMNDDVEIKTQNWDEIVLEFLSKEGLSLDKIFYLDTMDSTRNLNNVGNFACFPMMSRPLMEVLGWFFPPRIAGWGADFHMHKICKEAGCLHPFEKIYLDHHRDCDDEQHETMKKWAKFYGCGDDVNYTKEIKKIKEALENARINASSKSST